MTSDEREELLKLRKKFEQKHGHHVLPGRKFEEWGYRDRHRAKISGQQSNRVEAGGAGGI